MKTMREKLKARMRPNRPVCGITLRLPADVLEDMQDMAPALGFGDAHALIRAYISQGMRIDEAKLSQPEVLRETLERHGIAPEIISEVVAETLERSA